MDFIKLQNGKELEITSTIGGKQFQRGATRDVVTFYFPDGVSVDEIGELFSNKADLQEITLGKHEGKEESILQVLEGYTLCLEYGTKIEEVSTPNGAPDTVRKPYVSVAQLTYIEQQLEKILGAN